jgi:Ser/Thr protein kinase RdoA (MazF antagonist)
MEESFAQPQEQAVDFMDTQLANVLGDVYGITVQRFIKMKSVIGVVTQQGPHHIWKPVPQSVVRRVSLVYQPLLFLQQAGFRVALPVTSRTGSLVMRLPNGSVGQLLPWLSGSHLNLANRQQRLAAVASLAAWHKATVASMPETSLQSANSNLQRGKFVTKFQFKINLCARLWPSICSIFPQLQPYTSPLFKKLSDLTQGIAQWQGSMAFCHRDLAPHNLLWEEKDAELQRKIGWIDFDLADWDDPIGDLVQVMNHTVALVAIRSGDLPEMVETYAQNLPLSREAISMLWKALHFPDVFLRTAVQWLGQGTPIEGRQRVQDAWEVELGRWQVLTQDAACVVPMGDNTTM